MAKCPTSQSAVNCYRRTICGRRARRTYDLWTAAAAISPRLLLPPKMPLTSTEADGWTNCRTTPCHTSTGNQRSSIAQLAPRMRSIAIEISQIIAISLPSCDGFRSKYATHCSSCGIRSTSSLGLTEKYGGAVSRGAEHRLPFERGVRRAEGRHRSHRRTLNR